MTPTGCKEDIAMKCYSISFRYPHAVRGVSAPGIHLSLSVDEDAESRTLMHVENVVRNAARSVGLKMLHQYSWPDGSCYKWVLARTEEEFWSKFDRFRKLLKSPWMSVKIEPSYPTEEEDLLNGEMSGSHLCLLDRILGRPTLYYDASFKRKDPPTSYGGYSNADWYRYREHHAFADGFVSAFGQDTDFWHGGHPGYSPTVRAQELAGAGYHLGLLFKLLFYRGEDFALPD